MAKEELMEEILLMVKSVKMAAIWKKLETGEDSVTVVEPQATIETEKENMEDNAVTREKERDEDTSVASSHG